MKAVLIGLGMVADTHVAALKAAVSVGRLGDVLSAEIRTPWYWEKAYCGEPIRGSYALNTRAPMPETLLEKSQITGTETAGQTHRASRRHSSSVGGSQTLRSAIDILEPCAHCGIKCRSFVS